MNIDFNSCGSTTQLNTWSTPVRVGIIEKLDCIEFVYKETSMMTYAVHPSQPPEERVFKIVFSCKDGEWHKSDRMYGNIIPSQDEYYEFD